MQIACLYPFKQQSPSCFFEAKSGAEYVRNFLKILHLYWSRLAQYLLVSHHGYCVACGSRPNCAESPSRLEPHRYSAHDPSVYGYARTPTNAITYYLSGHFLEGGGDMGFEEAV